MENRDRTAQCIVVQEVLLQRKSELDEIRQGLQYLRDSRGKSLLEHVAVENVEEIFPR